MEKCEKCTICVYPLLLGECGHLFVFLYAVRVSVFGNKLKSVIKLNMNGKWNILLLMRGICLRYYIFYMYMFYIEGAHTPTPSNRFFLCGGIFTEDEVFSGMNRKVGGVPMKTKVMW